MSVWVGRRRIGLAKPLCKWSSTVAAILTVAAGAVWASPVSAQPQGQTPAGTDRRVAFDIPPQDLNSAILAFAERAGIRVFYDVSRVQGLRSNGVAGELTPSEALGRLLAGTGLTFRFTGANAVELQKLDAGALAPGALQLDPVQVQGVFPVPSQAMIDNIPPPYAGGQVATGSQLGLLGNRDVMDTPFNQTSYTAKKVQDQQARTVRDVLVDDPSVRSTWPAGSSFDEIVRIRGLTVSSLDTSFNGLYGIMPIASVQAELPERVEVLKGPSAMLNGMPPGGGIGGSVNIVPKRAGSQPLNQITAGYGYVGQFSGHADIARRFGPDEQFGARFNGVFRAGNTAIERNTEQVGLTSLGLDFRGERVRLSGDFGFQSQYIGGLVSFVRPNAGVAVPLAPFNSSNFGQTWSDTSRQDLFAVLRAEVDLTEKITAYAAFGAHDNRVNTFSAGNPAGTSFNGNITQTPFRQAVYNSFLTGEVGVRALVDTGPLSHEFAVSATTLQQEAGAGSVNGTAFTSNIYAPNLIARPNIASPIATKSSLTTLSGIAFADTISAANKRIQLTAGGRFQSVKAYNYDPVTGAQLSAYDESAFSPSVALVFKPWENVSLYGNWIQGLQPGQVVPAGFSNSGQIFAPYKSNQFEVGVKVDWGKLTTTVSAFQITQPSTITDTATNALVLAGQQRNQGIEINVFGEVAEGIRLLGGAMFIDAVLTQTQNGTTNGWQALGVPNVQFNLAGEWDTPFAKGLTLNGRVVYTGAQYIDVSYPRRTIPDWTRIDVGARYAFEGVKSPTGGPVTIRFNVENLFDASYWATSSNGFLLQGTPRTFRLSSTFDF
ncbi:TonB-dependent receptor [Reyranella sp.]|uniref:TonB-dependent receptor n=1 Tax=Reyranella sp. TaxID=1929291 RepID=UPI00121C9A53|nr:TonB-dependent receptor [Reyranella sp.]TAJ84772.1 MAG: TonB-dependent receptor [Reyranella sp.]